MARPRIRQPMPAIGEPLAVLASGEKIYPTEVYRRCWESENEALFGGDGSQDVTQGISEGGVELGTGTIGDYVQSLVGSGNITVTSGTGEGSTPTVGMVLSPTFNALTVSGNIAVGGMVDGRDIAADGLKLDGIASGATANATDAQLRDRATHSGAQAISTITGLQAALDGKVGTASITAIATDMSSDAFADELKAKINEIIAALA